MAALRAGGPAAPRAGPAVVLHGGVYPGRPGVCPLSPLSGTLSLWRARPVLCSQLKPHISESPSKNHTLMFTVPLEFPVHQAVPESHLGPDPGGPGHIGSPGPGGLGLGLPGDPTPLQLQSRAVRARGHSQRALSRTLRAGQQAPLAGRRREGVSAQRCGSRSPVHFPPQGCNQGKD